MTENLINSNPNAGLNSEIDSRLSTYSRFNGNTQVKKDYSETEKKEIEKSSRGFESIFVNMMFKEMRKAMIDKDNGDEDDMSFGGDVLEDYNGMLVADYISNTGKGIGLAERLYEHLTGGEKLESKITISTDKSGPLIPEKHESAPLPVMSKNPVISQSIDASDSNKKINLGLSQYEDIIKEASGKYNVPDTLIKAVIQAESAGNNSSVSKAGAKGLMQLMDDTARELGVTNSFEPRQNIMGGTKYLSQLLKKFDNNSQLAIAAYNAGPGNVDKFGGIPPFSETNAYVKKVLRYNDIFIKTNN